MINQAMLIDVRKINESGIKRLIRDKVNLSDLLDRALKYKLGVIFPLASIFISFFLLACINNIKNTIYIALFLCFSYFFLKLIYKILKSFNYNFSERGIFEFFKRSAESARGIQFFGIEDNLTESFVSLRNRIQQSTINDLKKIIWNNVFIISCVFIGFLTISEFYPKIRVTVKDIIILRDTFCVISIIFGFFVIISILRYYSLVCEANNSEDNVEKYLIQQNNEPPSQSIDSSKPSFLAFHGVCFFMPCDPSHQIFSDLTFSILPGERLVITGPSRDNDSYIFDLCLKFYKPQSGKIYLSGKNINTLSNLGVRSVFSVFDTNFCFINCTILENVRIANKNIEESSLLSIMERTGIIDIAEEYIFNTDGSSSFSQEIFIRIQIARAFLQNRDIILIKTPDFFENTENERLFYDFVDYISTKKSVIISSCDPKIIPYSQKVLFLDNETQHLFGSHAELSAEISYQNFFKNPI